MSGSNNPIVSKLFCSSSQASLLVRKRPPVVNGGGFVVTDSNNNHKVVFVVDGCGKLGAKGELLVKDGNGEPILYIHKKGGIMQALSTRNKWNSYSMDYQGKSKLLFSITDPKQCCSKQGTIKVNIETNKQFTCSWDYTINGSFADKIFAIVDNTQTIKAQVRVKEVTGSKDFYQVMVQPGFDQAFVIGVIAVLDNIFGESTRC